MSERSIVIVRHGETEWSKTGKHTGRTDVPLTDAGREAARALGPRLEVFRFARVLSSPLSRAWETCVLAGFGERAEKSDALLEWHYGDYEGKTTPEIRQSVPGWTVFTHGCPNGERGADVAARVTALLDELARSTGDGTGDVLLFAHAHVLRVLTGCWLGLGPEGGRLFTLETARISILARERESNVIKRWSC